MMDEVEAYNYFKSKLEQEGCFCTDTKIQIMMFIAHIYSLVKYDEPLFEKPFEAKKQGPVIPINKDTKC